MNCPKCGQEIATVRDCGASVIVRHRHSKTICAVEHKAFFILTPDMIEAARLADNYLDGRQPNRIIMADIGVHFRAAFAPVLQLTETETGEPK